jgi:hypothetical protein
MARTFLVKILCGAIFYYGYVAQQEGAIDYLPIPWMPNDHII